MTARTAAVVALRPDFLLVDNGVRIPSLQRDDDGATRGSGQLCDNGGVVRGFELAWRHEVARWAIVPIGTARHGSETIVLCLS